MFRFFILLVIFIPVAVPAQIPAPVGMVNDYEEILSETQEQELDSIIKSYKKKTKKEIAIVTKANVEPYKNVSDFCLDLFESWGIGLERDNGLLLFVSSYLGEVHITTGKKTKLVLNSDICMEIIFQHIVPYLKENKFYEGIKSGLLEIINLWK